MRKDLECMSCGLKENILLSDYYYQIMNETGWEAVKLDKNPDFVHANQKNRYGNLCVNCKVNFFAVKDIIE